MVEKTCPNFPFRGKNPLCTAFICYMYISLFSFILLSHSLKHETSSESKLSHTNLPTCQYKMTVDLWIGSFKKNYGVAVLTHYYGKKDRQMQWKGKSTFLYPVQKLYAGDKSGLRRELNSCVYIWMERNVERFFSVGNKKHVCKKTGCLNKDLLEVQIKLKAYGWFLHFECVERRNISCTEYITLGKKWRMRKSFCEKTMVVRKLVSWLQWE